MSFNYGLTPTDLSNVRKKIKNQEDYLESNKFTTSSGQVKSLLDVSYGANLSKRYYPRILNKVDTFTSYGVSKGLVPIFLTVTLDGFFRDLLHGDYTRFTDDVMLDYIKHIPNNDRHGFYYDLLEKKATLSPKDLYKILSHQLHRFNMCESLRNIRKDGFNYTSIRVTEPHKDGVPHFHILMYVPSSYIPMIYNDFKKFFPAPQNHKKLTLKNTFGANKRDGAFISYSTLNIDGITKRVKNVETKGFQTKIISASGYILKYILKSFTNLIDDNEIDYLQAWYIHNRIPRLITTHTLLSQEIYSKIAVLDDDWYYLTNIKLDGGLTKDAAKNYFKFDDGAGRCIVGDNGYFFILNGDKLVASYGVRKVLIPKYRLRSFSFISVRPKAFNVLHIYTIYIPPKKYSYYIKKAFKEDDSCCWITSPHDVFFIFDTTINDDIISSSNVVSIKKLSDLNLFNEYQTFDFDVYFPARFAMLHNELIKRGLLVSDPLNVNDYNMVFYDD